MWMRVTRPTLYMTLLLPRCEWVWQDPPSTWLCCCLDVNACDKTHPLHDFVVAQMWMRVTRPTLYMTLLLPRCKCVWQDSPSTWLCWCLDVNACDKAHPLHDFVVAQMWMHVTRPTPYMTLLLPRCECVWQDPPSTWLCCCPDVNECDKAHPLHDFVVAQMWMSVTRPTLCMTLLLPRCEWVWQGPPSTWLLLPRCEWVWQGPPSAWLCCCPDVNECDKTHPLHDFVVAQMWMSVTRPTLCMTLLLPRCEWVWQGPPSAWLCCCPDVNECDKAHPLHDFVVAQMWMSVTRPTLCMTLLLPRCEWVWQDPPSTWLCCCPDVNECDKTHPLHDFVVAQMWMRVTRPTPYMTLLLPRCECVWQDPPSTWLCCCPDVNECDKAHPLHDFVVAHLWMSVTRPTLCITLLLPRCEWVWQDPPSTWLCCCPDVNECDKTHPLHDFVVAQMWMSVTRSTLCMTLLLSRCEWVWQDPPSTWFCCCLDVNECDKSHPLHDFVVV